MSQINQYISGETIAATVMMMRRSQLIPKPIVLVEGDKDRRVLRNALSHHAEVVPGSGKSLTLDALNYIDINSAMEWLIVVVDADFDRLLGIKHDRVVLLTDAHDMDCEHIKSRALVKVVEELCSERKCLKEFSIRKAENPQALASEIRKVLLSVAAPIGLLRLISIQNGFELAFKKVEHAKVLERARFAVNVSSLISVVLAAGAKTGVTPSVLERELEKARAAGYDPWQICQGHDITKLLALAVRKYWGVGRLTEDEVERGIRLAYEAEYLWQTALGNEINTRLRGMGCKT